MKENDFREFLLNMRQNDAAIDKAVQYVREFGAYLESISTNADNAEIPQVKAYINKLVENRENSLDRIAALARYFYMLNRQQVYIYFTSILGGLGVLESIKSRAETHAGREYAGKIFNDIEIPAVGTQTEDLPPLIDTLMANFQANLPDHLCNKILAGNNHGIPKEAFAAEVEIFNNTESLDDYLEGLHQRKVDVLQKYCDAKKVWFEQVITQETVEYVKGNQEILSAVRKGNKLYVTKIPYDTPAFLKEKNPVQKRYHACHCPFVREAIKSGMDIPAQWCYCSAGFAKHIFETLFDETLEIKMLESALKGDDKCRFEITLPEKY